ncbi:hypothetical protein BH24GEM2_BH24GEM2_19160 [soil metagenome]
MLAGVAILLFLLVEVFVTVLHHWSGSGILGRVTSRVVWQSALKITRGMPHPRRRQLLGCVGPALIPLALLLWGVLAILGFALLYLPWMPEGFDSQVGIPRPSTLGDALYYSGVTFFTLGYGEVIALNGGMRALSVIEAGSGFALVTLGISYFTSVYPAYSHQQVLADSVLDQADGTADAAMLITQHLAGGLSTEVLGVELGRMRDALARVRSEYGSYPILYHFTASAPERSLLRLLFVVHDLVLLLDTAIDPRQHPALAGLGHRSGLARAADRTRKTLDQALLRTHVRPSADPADWTIRFRSACKILRAEGVAVCDDAAAVRAYHEGRGEWEPDLRAAAEALGEEWGEISGGY